MSYHYLNSSDNDCARHGASCRGICDPYLHPSLPFFATQNLEPIGFVDSSAPLDFAPDSRAFPNPDTLTRSLFGDETKYHPTSFSSSGDGYPNDGYYDTQGSTQDSTQDNTQDWGMPYPWTTTLTILTRGNPNEGHPMQQNNHTGYNGVEVPEANSYERGYSTQRCYPISHNGNEAPQTNSIEGGYSMQRFYPADHGDIEASQANPYEGRYSMQQHHRTGHTEDPQANYNEEHSTQQYHPAGHSTPKTAFEELQCPTFPPALQPTWQYPTNSPLDDNIALAEPARNTYILMYVPTLPPIIHRSPNSDTPPPQEPPSDRSSSPTVTPLQRRHQKRHQRRHICTYSPCSSHFKRSSDLARHVKSLHSRPPVEDLYQCKDEKCNRKGQEGFVRKDKWLCHAKARHGGA